MKNIHIHATTQVLSKGTLNEKKSKMCLEQ